MGVYSNISVSAKMDSLEGSSTFNVRSLTPTVTNPDYEDIDYSKNIEINDKTEDGDINLFESFVEKFWNNLLEWFKNWNSYEPVDVGIDKRGYLNYYIRGQKQRAKVSDLRKQLNNNFTYNIFFRRVTNMGNDTVIYEFGPYVALYEEYLAGNIKLTHSEVVKLKNIYNVYKFYEDAYCDRLETYVYTDAETCVLMDAETGEFVYSNGADKRMEPASMTKVLTALVVMDYCKNLNDRVYYTDETHNAIPSDSSTAGIPSGSYITVEDALYALLVASDNESAVALANYVCGSEEEFNKLLNEKAKELGCTGTNFTNGHGYSDPNHYTTAADMALMMQAATSNDVLNEIMETYQNRIIKTSTGEEVVIKSHCDILKPTLSYGRKNDNYYEYAECAKTGSTSEAGQTLCVSANKDGHRYIVVVMNDDNRDKDAAQLFDAAYTYDENH